MRLKIADARRWLGGPAAKRRRWAARPRWQRAAVALVVCLLVAEALLRIAGPSNLRTDPLFGRDAAGFFRLKTSYQGTFMGQVCHTNTFGHRDAEIPLAKPPGTVRIVAIGDSVTFGDGVAGENAYSQALESKLRIQLAPTPVDVINAGVPGRGPRMEYEDLRRALVLAPDLAILQISANDIRQPDMTWWQRRLLQVIRTSRVGWMLVRFIRYGSFDTRAVEAAVDREAFMLDWQVSEDPPASDTVWKAWERSRAWWARSIGLCRKRGIPVVLLVCPVEFQLTEPSRRYPQRALREFANQQGVEVVDVLEMVQRAARPEEPPRALWVRYFLDPAHPTPAGHHLIAASLQPVVERMLAARAQHHVTLEHPINEWRQRMARGVRDE